MPLDDKKKENQNFADFLKFLQDDNATSYEDSTFGESFDIEKFIKETSTPQSDAINTDKKETISNKKETISNITPKIDVQKVESKVEDTPIVLEEEKEMAEVENSLNTEAIDSELNGIDDFNGQATTTPQNSSIQSLEARILELQNRFNEVNRKEPNFDQNTFEDIEVESSKSDAEFLHNISNTIQILRGSLENIVNKKRVQDQTIIASLREKTTRLKAINLALNSEVKKAKNEKLESLRKSTQQTKELLALRMQLAKVEEHAKHGDFKLSNLEQQITILTQEKANLDEEITRIRQEKLNFIRTSADQTQNIMDLRLKLTKSEDKFKQEEIQNNFLKEQLKAVETACANLTSETNTIKQEKFEHEKSLVLQREEIATLKVQLAKSQETLNKQATEAGKLREELLALQYEFQQKQNEAASMSVKNEETLMRLESSQTEYNRRLERLRQEQIAELDHLKAEKLEEEKLLQAELKRTEDKFHQEEMFVKTLQTKISDLTDALTRLDSEKTNLSGKSRELEQEINSIRESHTREIANLQEELKRAQDSYDKEHNAYQSLTEQKQNIEQEKYYLGEELKKVLALKDDALSKNEQYICQIEELKLAQDTLAKKLQTDIQTLLSEKEQASKEFTALENKYKEQEAVLSKDLQNAKEEYQKKQAVVDSLQIQIKSLEDTKEGLQSKVGGREENQKGLISKIQGLESEKSNLVNEKQDLTNKVSGLENDKNNLLGQVQDLQSVKIDLTGKIQGLENEKSNLTSQVSGLTSEKQDLTNKVSGLENDKNNLLGQVQDLQNTKTDLTGKIQGLENEKYNLTSQVSGLTSEKQELSNKVSGLENDKNNLLGQVQDLQNTKTDLTGKIQGLENEKSNLTSQVSGLTNENQNLTNKVSNLESDKNNLLGQVQDLQNVKTDLTDKIQGLESEKSNLSTKIQGLEGDKSTLISKVSGLENDKNNLLGQVQDLQEERFNLSNQVQSLSNEKSNLSTKIQGLESEKSFLKSKTQNLEQEITQQKAVLGKDIESLRAELANAQKELAESRSVHFALNETHIKAEQDLVALKNSIKESDNSIALLKQQLSALFSSKVNLDSDLQKAREEKFDLLNQLKERSQALSDFEQKYQQEITLLKEEHTKQTSLLETKINDLNVKLNEKQQNIESLKTQIVSLEEAKEQNSNLSQTRFYEQEKEINDLKTELAKAKNNFSQDTILLAQLKEQYIEKQESEKQLLAHLEVLTKEKQKAESISASYKQQVEKLEKELETTKQQLTEEKEHFQQLQTYTEKLKAVNAALNVEIKRVQEEKVNALNKSAEQAQEILLLKEQLSKVGGSKTLEFQNGLITLRKEYEEKIQHIEQKLKEASALCVAQAQEIITLKTDNEKLRTAAEEKINLQSRYNALQKNITTLTAELENYKKQELSQQELDKENTLIKARTAALSAQLSRVKGDKTSLETQLALAKSELENASDKEKQTAETLTSLKNKLAENDTLISKLKDEIALLVKENKDLKENKNKETESIQLALQEAQKYKAEQSAQNAKILEENKLMQENLKKAEQTKAEQESKIAQVMAELKLMQENLKKAEQLKAEREEKALKAEEEIKTMQNALKQAQQNKESDSIKNKKIEEELKQAKILQAAQTVKATNALKEAQEAQLALKKLQEEQKIQQKAMELELANAHREAEKAQLQIKQIQENAKNSMQNVSSVKLNEETETFTDSFTQPIQKPAKPKAPNFAKKPESPKQEIEEESNITLTEAEQTQIEDILGSIQNDDNAEEVNFNDEEIDLSMIFDDDDTATGTSNSFDDATKTETATNAKQGEPMRAINTKDILDPYSKMEMTDHSIRRSIVNRKPHAVNPQSSMTDKEYSDFLNKTKSMFYRIKWSLFKD